MTIIDNRKKYVFIEKVKSNENLQWISFWEPEKEENSMKFNDSIRPNLWFLEINTKSKSLTEFKSKHVPLIIKLTSGIEICINFNIYNEWNKKLKDTQAD